MRTNGWKAVVLKQVCLVLVAVTVLGLSVNSAVAQTESCLLPDFPPAYPDGVQDGHIDGLDYLLWARFFDLTADGTLPAPDPPGAPFNGDYTRNSVTNGLDYLCWAANFDSSYDLDDATVASQPPTMALSESYDHATVVPEPSTMVLGLVAGAGMFLSPRRRRRMG